LRQKRIYRHIEILEKYEYGANMNRGRGKREDRVEFIKHDK